MGASKNQSGVALLLALMLTSLTVLIVLFAASIGGQLRFSGSSADSTRAFAAADAGIEYAMSRINLGLAVGQDASSCQCGTTWCEASAGFASDTQYCVTADNPSSPRKITAVGRTLDTKIRRSLEVVLPTFAAVNTFSTVCFNNDGIAKTLDQICQQQATPYAGATGIVATLSGVCTSGSTFQAGILGLHRSGTPTFGQTSPAYLIQCYR